MKREGRFYAHRGAMSHPTSFVHDSRQRLNIADFGRWGIIVAMFTAWLLNRGSL